ncbi:hypothetical protein Tco_0939650 [Tanacetum coccineum]|uniref:Uncharacterized protein n=1 Tax=Tanacetum coccineum TaxID=301880 RepID=A0ABQ5DKP4_9ASTR
MDELIDHVSEKTYAYGAIRAENQNLLVTISELKARMKNGEHDFKDPILAIQLPLCPSKMILTLYTFCPIVCLRIARVYTRWGEVVMVIGLEWGEDLSGSYSAREVGLGSMAGKGLGRYTV